MSTSPLHVPPPAELADRVVFSDDSGFDTARQEWNLALDQTPAAVVYAESADDVVAAVRFAGELGLPVTALSTGHNAAPLGRCEDIVLVKTERMRGVTIDPRARTARIEAGVRWLQVVEAAAEHGLAALSGSSPDVGVVGYVLGGGVSLIGRALGLCTNSVRAIELVTADGVLHRVDHDNEPDLFWALRGGGGNFGIVTAVEIDLFAIERVYAGILWFPIERAAEVLRTWRELTHSPVPDELGTVGRFLRFPPIDEIPEPVRGKSFVLVEAFYTGDDQGAADAALEPLRALGPVNDTIAPISTPVLSHLHMDPEHPCPGAGDGLMLDTLPPEAVEAFIDIAGGPAGDAMLSIEMRHLGGAWARSDPSHGVCDRIDAQYIVFAAGMLPAPEFEGPIRESFAALRTALAPWISQRMYLNFAETSRDPDELWGPENHARLREIKKRYDPDNRIRGNHPIVPAA